ncbi:MAG: hypothetical protein U0325_21015 [Polyangiales bacterium]
MLAHGAGVGCAVARDDEGSDVEGGVAHRSVDDLREAEQVVEVQHRGHAGHQDRVVEPVEAAVGVEIEAGCEQVHRQGRSAVLARDDELAQRPAAPVGEQVRELELEIRRRALGVAHAERSDAAVVHEGEQAEAAVRGQANRALVAARRVARRVPDLVDVHVEPEPVRLRHLRAIVADHEQRDGLAADHHLADALVKARRRQRCGAPLVAGGKLRRRRRRGAAGDGVAVLDESPHVDGLGVHRVSLRWPGVWRLQR